MEKEFVPYKEALALKEIEFNEPCFGYYYTLNGKDWKFAEKTEYYRLDDEINIGPKFSLLAPTYSQAFRWFRENYGMCAHIKPENNEEDVIAWEYVILTISDSEVCFTIRKSNYSLSEEAELACLRKLIEIVKDA